MSKYTPRKPLHILDYRLGRYIDIYKSNIKRWMCQGKYTIVFYMHLFVSKENKKGRNIHPP